MAVEPLSLNEARSSDPELATPRSKPSKIKTVLLATDLSPVSEIATTQALDLAASIGARLLIVNVIDLEGLMLAIVDAARMRGIDATFLLWTGEPGQGIVAAAEAEQADLIVVGTRGLDRAGRFLLGSVSDYVVYHSVCPVLVAH